MLHNLYINCLFWLFTYPHICILHAYASSLLSYPTQIADSVERIKWQFTSGSNVGKSTDAVLREIDYKTVRLVQIRKSHYWLLAATILQCGMSVIPFLEFLVLSRFLLGILNAFYVSIASSYLKENFPFNLRKKMGAIYSVGRILGILICYSIGELSDYS